MNTIGNPFLPTGSRSLGAETQPGLARAGLLHVGPSVLFITRRASPAIFGKAFSLVTGGERALTNGLGAPRCKNSDRAATSDYMRLKPSLSGCDGR
jgi:hypothetical protein